MRTSHTRVRTGQFFSLAVAGVGATLWILSFIALQTEARQLVQAGALLTSISFIFFATQLTIVGVAFYAYSLSKRNRGEEDEVESTLDRLELMLNRQRGSGSSSSPATALHLDLDTLRGLQSKQRFSRIHLIATFEGAVVLALFSWLVKEYESNTYMQGWVLGSFPLAKYALNFTCVALLAGFYSGIVASQFVVLSRARKNQSLRP